MFKLNASTIIINGTLTLSLNGEIILEGIGQIEKELAMNKDYALSWKVQGSNRPTYTISISTNQGDEVYIKGSQCRSNDSEGMISFVAGQN